jgi:hypothetical protein
MLYSCPSGGGKRSWEYPPPTGSGLHVLAKQKECQIVERDLMPDHVHMCIAIPPKHPVASVIGFLKGKSAIAIARLCGKQRNFSGEHFWARGYAVSTVGFELHRCANTSASRMPRMVADNTETRNLRRASRGV